MKSFVTAVAGSTLALAMAFSGAPAARAQMTGPMYQSRQANWDTGRYDRHHLMIGTIVSYAPYRVTLTRRNGVTQTVDLKNGTVIRPTGATPSPGNRVALVGYYSNGTFVVNRMILR